MSKEATRALQAGATKADFGRALRFVEAGPGGLARAAEELWREGRRRFVIHGERNEVEALAGRLHADHPELEERTSQEASGPRPDSAYFYPGLDGEALAGALTRHLDERHAAVVAPRGVRHCSNMPLFLISIPKSGTHLLYELARALGYRDGVVCPEHPAGGHWYCIEYSNSHTRAADFLVDTTRRSPFGNKHHPFFRAPALFIYRNPRDILVSEANWFHRSANSPLAGYLCDLSFEERLLRLIDDPWLLGSIRERVGAFIPWLSFPNVTPISFEELVGERGGGSDAAQLDLIWSIQLKLHADGSPEGIARMLVNPESPTFADGRIGAWEKRSTPEARQKFALLPRDFLEVYGFSDDRGASPPSRAAEFRRRDVRFADADFSTTPIAIESGYLGHNIVQFRNRFYAIPQGLGPMALDSEGADRLADYVSGETLDAAKIAVLKRSIVIPEVVMRSQQYLERLSNTSESGRVLIGKLAVRVARRLKRALGWSRVG